MILIFIVLLFLILIVMFKKSVSIKIGNQNTPLPSNNEESVTITVTPRPWQNGSSTWDFEVALNTHSEELKIDLVTAAELIDDRGQSYRPLSWEGSPPGGHHRRGVLKFKASAYQPKSLELKIKNSGGLAERSFKWNF